MSTIEVDTITDCSGIGAPNFPYGASGLPKPHTPNAVSGATPSLDVGAYNFFDQGALTADTTVSFANVPTNAKWQYSYVSAADTTNAFTLVDAGTNGIASTGELFRGGQTRGLSVSPDGTRFWTVDSRTDYIYQYNLLTPFDLTTWEYRNIRFRINSQSAFPWGLFFGDSGYKMYVVDATLHKIFQYNLTVKYDISSAVYENKNATVSESVNVFFKPDGLTAYFVRDSNKDVLQVALGRAWDVDFFGAISGPFNPSFSNTAAGLCISPDGTKMIIAEVGQRLHQFTLSTPWEISTASADNVTYVGPDTNCYGLSFNADGTVLYASSYGGNIYGITLNLGKFEITLPSIVGTPNVTAVGDRVTYAFDTSDAGTTVNLIAEDQIA